MKPLSGFYCALCREIFLDESSAEQHLKGHQHYVNYDVSIHSCVSIYLLSLNLGTLFQIYFAFGIHFKLL